MRLRVRELREARFLSIADLAARSGLSKGAILKIEPAELIVGDENPKLQGDGKDEPHDLGNAH